MAVLADLVAAEARLAGELPVLAVYPSDPALVDAVLRLVKLLEAPASGA